MNLQKQILIEHTVINAELIAKYIEENPNDLEELIYLILQGDKITAQRAAWVLGKFTIDFYEKFIPYLDFILSEINNAKHVAVTRNFARVFKNITDPKKEYSVTNKQIDSIVDFSFSRIIDNSEKAGVIMFSIVALQNLIPKRSWIANDLRLHIENNMSGSLPSFQSVGRRVLKSLNAVKK